MEKIVELQKNIKNKMKERLQANLESEISNVEDQISTIKVEYENQKHKEGFFLKTHYHDCKNKYMPNLGFFLIVFSFLTLFVFNVYTYGEIINEKSYPRSFVFFSIFTLTFLPYGILTSFLSSLYYSTNYGSENILKLKTKLTSKYEDLNASLKILKIKLSCLDQHLNDYMNNDFKEDSLNEDDISNMAETILSEKELHEISEIFTEKDLMNLSFMVVNDIYEDDLNEEDISKSVINIRYCDVLHFIDIKECYDIKNITNSIFKTEIK